MRLILALALTSMVPTVALTKGGGYSYTRYNSSHYASTKAVGVPRDSHGEIKCSSSARHAFGDYLPNYRLLT